MCLTAKALGLCCQILRVFPGETTVILSNDHPFLEGLNIRDQGWISTGG